MHMIVSWMFIIMNFIINMTLQFTSSIHLNKMWLVAKTHTLGVVGKQIKFTGTVSTHVQTTIGVLKSSMFLSESYGSFVWTIVYWARSVCLGLAVDQLLMLWGLDCVPLKFKIPPSQWCQLKTKSQSTLVLWLLAWQSSLRTLHHSSTFKPLTRYEGRNPAGGQGICGVLQRVLHAWLSTQWVEIMDACSEHGAHGFQVHSFETRVADLEKLGREWGLRHRLSGTYENCPTLVLFWG